MTNKSCSKKNFKKKFQKKSREFVVRTLNRVQNKETTQNSPVPQPAPTDNKCGYGKCALKPPNKYNASFIVAKVPAARPFGHNSSQLTLFLSDHIRPGSGKQRRFGLISVHSPYINKQVWQHNIYLKKISQKD